MRPPEIWRKFRLSRTHQSWWPWKFRGFFACFHTVTVNCCALHGQKSICFHQGLCGEWCWILVEGKDLLRLGYVYKYIGFYNKLSCWERKRGVGGLIKGVPLGHSSWQKMPWPRSLGTPLPLHPVLLAVKRVFPITVSGSLLVATVFFQTASEDIFRNCFGSCFTVRRCFQSRLEFAHAL